MTTNFTMMVRDRFNLTSQALSSLATAGMEEITVTVLDDRSQNPTRDWVFWWCKDHNAHYVRNEVPMGTGPLRNLVIRESAKFYGKGKYLAPHDNDTCFTANWTTKMIQCYEFIERHGFRLLSGVGHPYHLPVSKFVARIPSGDYEIQQVQAVPTQSQFMAWSTYDDIGEFCDTPVDKTCQSEDVEWSNKLVAKGFKLGVVYPHLIHATALKNTFGEPGPGWELVKKECPPNVICE